MAGLVPIAFLLGIGCTTSPQVELPELPAGHPARAENSPVGRLATPPRLVEDEITRGTASRLNREAAPPMDMSVPMAEKKDASPAENTPAKVSYTCPMHPEIHQSAPGNCPICGMKLVAEKSSPRSR